MNSEKIKAFRDCHRGQYSNVGHCAQCCLLGRKTCITLFVHVIGLHAVQFGNNWMRKILRAAKTGSPRNFLNRIISKLDKHVVLLPITVKRALPWPPNKL